MAFIIPAIISVLLAFIVQLFHQNLNFKDTIQFIAKKSTIFILSVLIIVGFYIFILGLLGNLAFACSVSIFLFGVLAYANYLMLYYRKQPLHVRDLSMILNLKGLLSMLSPVIIFALIVLFTLLTSATILLDSFISIELDIIPRIIMGCLGLINCACLCFAGIKGSCVDKFFKLMGAKIDEFVIWGNTYKSYEYNGFLIAFFSYFQRPLIEKPENYSEDSIKLLVEKYKNTTKSSRTPHIIYIMSEAFSDPCVFKDLSFSEDPIPKIREIMKNYPSGNIFAPGYGGGTAHCECEALTGFSNGLTGGISMYENNIASHKKFQSLPQRLKNYSRIALHPYKSGMYARTEVYPILRIDKFIDERGFLDKNKIDNNLYISDECAYKEVFDLLLTSELPLFLHLVTMQNHGDYAAKNRFKNSIIANTPFTSKENSQLETYLQGIKYTDDATANFLNKLKSFKDDVVVVFWGDHLPMAYPNEYINNKPFERFKTPFFIWANYPLKPVESSTISPAMLISKLSYCADISRSSFDLFMQDLNSEIGVIHERCIMNSKNEVILPEELSKQALQLYENYRLLQYDVMYGKNHSTKLGFYD